MIEVRISSEKRLEAAIASGCDAISMGSEGCPKKLLAAAGISSVFARIGEAGLEPRLVVPFSPEADSPQLKQLVFRVSEEFPGMHFTFNDLGLLDFFSQKLAGKTSLGVFECWSPAQSPWRAAGPAPGPWLSVANDSSAKLLSSLGVSGVETAFFNGAGPSTDFLRQRGFHVACHADLSRISFSRSCPFCRLSGVLADGSCREECDEPLMLVPPGNAPSLRHAASLCAFENALCAAPEQFEPRGFDRVILTASLYSEKSLADKVASLE